MYLVWLVARGIACDAILYQGRLATGRTISRQIAHAFKFQT